VRLVYLKHRERRLWKRALGRANSLRRSPPTGSSSNDSSEPRATDHALMFVGKQVYTRESLCEYACCIADATVLAVAMAVVTRRARACMCLPEPGHGRSEVVPPSSQRDRTLLLEHSHVILIAGRSHEDLHRLQTIALDASCIHRMQAWDPWLICRQIAVLQSVFYVGLVVAELVFVGARPSACIASGYRIKLASKLPTFWHASA
jgi:hypothetical protein